MNFGKSLGKNLASTAANEAIGAGVGELSEATGVEVPDVVQDAVTDAASGAVDDRLGMGDDGAPQMNPMTQAMGDKLGQQVMNQMQEEAKGQVMGNAPEGMQNMAGQGFDTGMGALSGQVDSAAAAAGQRTMTFNTYQQPGKKATTILSPHLETITYGSMTIVLDNQ